MNDKPTGAVVGQQPFGGARASGTNDKAGSKLNLVRWVSAARGQGDLQPAARLPLPVHGRGVGQAWRETAARRGGLGPSLALASSRARAPSGRGGRDRGGGARLPPQLLGRAQVLQRDLRPARVRLLPGPRAELRDRLPRRAVGAAAPRARRAPLRPAERRRSPRSPSSRSACGSCPARCPASTAAAGWLAAARYLSNFVVASTTGLLYRATKPLVAPLLLVLLLLALAEHRRPRLGAASRLRRRLRDRPRDEPARPPGALLPAAASSPSLGAAWLRSRPRAGSRPRRAVAAAVAPGPPTATALGPWVIHALNGYWPETRFQRLRPALAAAPASPGCEGARLLGDWTRGAPRRDPAASRSVPRPPWPPRRGRGASGAGRGASPSSPWPRVAALASPGRHGRDHGRSATRP